MNSLSDFVHLICVYSFGFFVVRILRPNASFYKTLLWFLVLLTPACFSKLIQMFFGQNLLWSSFLMGINGVLLLFMIDMLMGTYSESYTKKIMKFLRNESRD